MSDFPQLLLLTTAREGSHLVMPFPSPGPLFPPASPADGRAGVSADSETGGPCGRFFGKPLARLAIGPSCKGEESLVTIYHTST
jgi:hypothetical protein